MWYEEDYKKFKITDDLKQQFESFEKSCNPPFGNSILVQQILISDSTKKCINKETKDAKLA